MATVIERYQKTLALLKTESFAGIIKKVMLFLKGLLPVYGRYYLFEHHLIERNEADFLPVIPGLTCKIIESNEEADEIENNGLEFRRVFTEARRNLDMGCIAICIFIGGKIANISWIALTEEAKHCFDALPFKVDFNNNEACFGGMFTLPEFRGKGLMVYARFKQLQIAGQKGVKIARNSILIDNLASQKANSHFSPVKYAVARYYTVLGLKFYNENKI